LKMGLDSQGKTPYDVSEQRDKQMLSNPQTKESFL